METTTRSLKLRVKLRSKKGGILAFLVKAPNVTADKGNERQNRNEEAVVVLGVGRLTSFKKHHLNKKKTPKETKEKLTNKINV